jgi:uncharacterized iron-regulated protein
MLFAAKVFSQNPPAYRIFDSKGTEVTYNDVVNTSLGSDIVFFGEQHNDPIVHWLQFELTKALFDKKGNSLILGAEMFESDDQIVLNEFLQGLIPAKKLGDEAKLWPNYETDYRPLVEFALINKLPFIATNVPRRYAGIVAASGFEGLNSLSPEALLLLAPLPIAYDGNLNCYKSMLDMGGMGGMGQNKMSQVNLPKAQALKDATMAHFIMKYFTKGKLFLHYNGSYHSDNHEGIVWYIKQKDKDLKVTVISSVSQPDVSTLLEENKGVGDFILCVPENMTKTQ